ncbi:metalloendopeptidase OMA1, mitochondrial-like [Gigantopelta aegis]|uniref:metalloendopeptidase OMA1, mitochondrial-like n=1 Tax=Gigantopelta aegis TaxID=1735272 RepID=UPI001B8886B4|nr:metalloendopeptidase OMA1, mitochondrial-like [Gigantopelta aegis]
MASVNYLAKTCACCSLLGKGHNIISKVLFSKLTHPVLQHNKALSSTRLIKNDFLQVKSSLQTRFSTSSQRNIPPILWLFVKPIAKVSAALTGRRVRKWWQSLPKDKKMHFKTRMTQNWPIFALAGGGLVVTGFVYYELHVQETPVTGRKRFIAVTHNQLIKIASVEAQSHLDKFEGSLIPIDKPVWKRVERVANRIIESNPIIKSMDVKNWKLTLIDDKTINAFVVPNGHIFVFLGLVEFVDNDDQLAFVLGHEMAHALLSHGAEQISYAQFVDFIVIAILAAIWTIMPTDGFALVTQWFNNKVMELMLHLPYSRKLEKEADKVGLDLAARACYDIRGSSVFWQKMEIREQYIDDNEAVPEWLSTHPASGNRVKFLDYLIPQALVVREGCKCFRLPAHDPRDHYKSLEQELQNTTIARRAGQNLQKVPVLPTTVS